MDTENQVVTMPLETFTEINSSYTPPTAAQRVAGTAQALVVLTAVASIVPIASYAWVRCQNWLDERRLEREKARRSSNLSSVQ